jgi:hypothetical protein
VLRVTRGRIVAVVALGALALAYAVPLASVGCPQTSHYAATRAIAAGHPDIDRYAKETCDLVRVGRHFYAAKAPGMDLWSVPWYLLLHVTGAVPRNPNAGLAYPAAMSGIPLRAIWQIGLWAVVLPALALLALLRRTVERLEPGLGTAAAVVLGMSTLILPFSTLLFAHVPAAALAFLSFALLFDRDAGRLRVAAAGAAAGLAVSTDLPLAVPAVLLGLYAAARTPHLRRLVAFGIGGVVGLVPLLAFDWWAFGSPFHLPYSGVALNPGASGVEQTAGGHGFFTLQLPDVRVAVELLLSQRGLLVLTPVVAAGVAGTVLLWRRALRAEAVLIAALCIVEITWISGHNGKDMALGGWVPGPRFLIPLLPFLCFALAPALRRAPATVGALAVVSAGAMAVATSAEPLLSNDDTHHWIARIVDGNFTATIVSFTGIGHGWLAILPFYALLLVALVAALLATPLPIRRRDAITAVVALVGWIVVEHGAPALLQVDRLVHESFGLLAAVALVGALAWAILRLFDGRSAAAAPALLLLAFGARRFDEHTKWALLLALLVLGALALQPALADRVRRRGIPA